MKQEQQGKRISIKRNLFQKKKNGDRKSDCLNHIESEQFRSKLRFIKQARGGGQGKKRG